MLLKWQQQHFMQANETPFASNFWHKELQKEDVQTAILNGTYEAPLELPLEAKEILKEMQRPMTVEEDTVPEATLQDFKNYIKKFMKKGRRPHQADTMGTIKCSSHRKKNICK